MSQRVGDALTYMIWASALRGDEAVIRRHRQAMKALDHQERFQALERFLLNLFAALRTCDVASLKPDDRDVAFVQEGARVLQFQFDKLRRDWDRVLKQHACVDLPSREFLDAVDLLAAAMKPTSEWLHGKAVQSALGDAEPKLGGGRKQG